MAKKEVENWYIGKNKGSSFIDSMFKIWVKGKIYRKLNFYQFLEKLVDIYEKR